MTEEVADAYLDEFIHWCMLRVSKRNNFGRVNLCQMHNILRKVALSIGQRVNFCRVYNNEEDESISEVCRLSVQKGSGNLKSGRCIPRTRTFFLFDANKLP